MFNVVILLFFAVLTCLVTGLAPPYYGTDRASMQFELPPLHFGFGELEPYIEAATVQLHYLGHHAKYTENMNNALKEWRKKDKQASRVSIVEVLRNLTIVPETWRETLRNHGGGFVNHNFYWSGLSPNTQGKERRPTGDLLADIVKQWKSYDNFKEEFTKKAVGLFGSGYVWLCRNITLEKSSNDLSILSTANQDSPLSLGLVPMLVIDVWEHAYYLKYRNLRVQYVDSWWMLVDWDHVVHLDLWWKGIKLHDEL